MDVVFFKHHNIFGTFQMLTLSLSLSVQYLIFIDDMIHHLKMSERKVHVKGNQNNLDMFISYQICFE